MRRQETQQMMRWAVFILFLLILAAASWQVVVQSQARYRTTAAFRKMESVKITVVNDQGERLLLEVRLADEQDDQASGFEGIGPGVILRSAILVVYDRDTITHFSTRNVELPIELAFIRSDGVVLDVILTEPGSVELYSLGTQFRYVLEAPSGYFQARSISNRRSALDVGSLGASLE